jgi:hypothetical protein
MFDQAGPTVRIASNSEFLHRGFWIESNRPSGGRIRPGFERKSGSSGGAFFSAPEPGFGPTRTCGGFAGKRTWGRQCTILIYEYTALIEQCRCRDTRSLEA